MSLVLLNKKWALKSFLILNNNYTYRKNKIKYKSENHSNLGFEVLIPNKPEDVVMGGFGL